MLKLLNEPIFPSIEKQDYDLQTVPALHNIILLMNFYNISQIPERQQTTQHYHSSLEEPTLENVEAQLYAARQRNYELAMSYFQNKYGSGEVYNKYVETNQLEGLGAPKEPVYDFKRELARKAMEIQQQEMKKIANKKQSQQQREEEGQHIGRKSKKPRERNNIWIKQQRYEETSQEERTKPQSYEINVHTQNQKSFISDFKNYLNNKKKLKSEQQQQSKLQFNQSSTSNFKQSSLIRSPSKGKGEKEGDKCYEEELVKKMFRQITGKTDKSTLIEKVDLIQYLNSNKKILKVLGITPEEVSTTIMAYQSSNPNEFNMNEGLLWVLNCLGKIDEAKKLKAQQQFQNVPQGCMLSKQLLQVFEDTFRAIDRHNDLIIKRVPFVSRLTSLPQVKNNLNLPAVYEPEYNRHVSLRRILQRIEIQTLLCSQQERKLNEYISWNQFITYFQSGHNQRAKYDLIMLIQSLRNEQKFGFSHLPDSVCEMIATAFKRIDRGQQLFNTNQVINQIKLHKDYQTEKYTFLKHNEQSEISQTFDDVLVRIKEHGLKYVNPKEFLEYFSERRRPIEDYETERNEKQAKNLSPSKVTIAQKQMFPKAEQAPDGYDSDPQIYNNSKLHEVEGKKSQKEFKRSKLASKSFLQADIKARPFQEAGDSSMKVTIPQPFSFDQREKQRQLARSQQKILQTVPEMQKFKAEPAPAKVIQVGIYQKMMAQQQKKNEDRKRSSMIMTLANERPFSFLNRKTNKKTRQEREQFIFKAKPIPWFCSVDLLARKKEQEIGRKEKIAKTAQESLAKAKLPPRMEKDFLEKQAKKALSPGGKGRQTQSLMKVKEPPNFSRLHKQFQEAMERKRKQNKPTEIKEFKFSSTAKDNFSQLKVQQSEIQQIKRHSYEPPTKSNIDIFAQSTAKFTQQVEKRRKQMEQKRREEERKKKQDQERMKIDEELKRKVQEAARKNKENNDKKTQEKIKAEKNMQQQQTAEYKTRKNQIIAKARQQPMLMERISKRNEKLQRMEKLWEISQTLIKNGIKGKEHDHYFKREELILIDDYKQLKQLQKKK